MTPTEAAKPDVRGVEGRTPSLRWRVRTAINGSPHLYLPLARLKGDPDQGAVGPDTEVVIEGYPRSANTFSVAAFRHAVGRPVVIGHHLHAPAQVVAGVRRGLPVILLFRHPEESVLSLRAYAPDVSTRAALEEYVRFHRLVRPYRGGCVLAHFPDVVGDFGGVMHRLNERFRTAYPLFVHTPENVAACFRAIDATQERRSGRVSRVFVQRPTEERTRRKEAVRAAFHAPSLASLRRRAFGLYRAFCRYADVDPDARDDVLGSRPR